MADTIKIGTSGATFKVGSDDVTAIYLGNTLVYSGGTPPTPPTPTYTWRKYYEGETVPSRTVYGVKLYIDLADDFEIDFGDSHDGIAFIYEMANNEWTALDAETSEPIDISEYFDGEECYTILFSDLGYDGIEIAYPIPGEDFAFDIELYVEPSLQWATFKTGDTIPSDLDVYGVSGISQDLLDTFECNVGNKLCFQPSRRNVEYYLYDNNLDVCASDVEAATNPIELIFSDIGCFDYINQGSTVSGTIKLYIYA